jgi:membrane-bound serine protease (ClpP class)
MLATLKPLARVAVLAILAVGLPEAAAQKADSAAARTATLLTIHDAIGPATSHYLARGIEAATDRGSTLIVIEMDTPGGLDTSMREIIQAILASPVPVVTFVHPPGARAASAGTYILYASHVAAMAPATNLGAATPVSIGGRPPPDSRARDGAGDSEPTEGAEPEVEDSRPRAPEPTTASERKAINDSVAYIRSLAEQRGRNAEWAERAVRSGESLSAQAALAAGVVDVIANDVDDLFLKLDGRRVNVNGTEQTLSTDGLIYERVEPDWRTRLLAVITNPTVAYMLMLLGIYGLIFEGYSPGAILPGVVGAISLLLALYAFQILPVNYAGLALIALGVVLIIAEFMVPSFGALGFGGVAAFVFGSVILIDTDIPGYGVSIPLLVAIATAAAVALVGLIWIAMRSRKLPVVSGVEQLTKAVATALEDFDREGAVWVHGERWRARSAVPVRKGQHVRVIAVENLVLRVEPHATDQQ